MEDIIEYVKKFFDTDSFPARWHCGKWSEFHGWLYILSDVAIWAAYFTIPFILLRFIRNKKDVPFRRVFWLFGAFILACGATHLIDAAIFWFPMYRVSAFVRMVTAIVSWATIFALYKIIPHALLLRTPKEMELEVQLRTEELNDVVKKMRFMADVMPQMVYTATPDGTRDYFNKKTVEYTGKTYKELEGWKWIDLIHPDDRPQFQVGWNESVEYGNAFQHEVRILAANGNYYWHLTRALPQRDEHGRIACWVGTATEIEQQKRTAEILENLVLQRTEELRHANQQLLQSNKDLEHFAAFASHDLQAPLRTISTYLGLIRDRNAVVLDEKSNNIISKAIAASVRMRNLIETLLQFSKVNASQALLTEVDLVSLIAAIRISINDADGSKKAIITNGTLVRINADESLIGQLLQNLISNGINYNENEVPKVHIEAYKQGNEVIISVTDNGIGIERDDLDSIFDVFTRLQSQIKGTGLGLSISKRIVEKHAGRVWVESEINKGTTFYIALPDTRPGTSQPKK